MFSPIYHGRLAVSSLFTASHGSSSCWSKPAIDFRQAIHYTAFAVSSLFTASLQHYLASKWILVLSTIFFGVYHLGFFYINSFYFYGSQIMMGIACSCR